jgi:hypothetical protein
LRVSGIFASASLRVRTDKDSHQAGAVLVELLDIPGIRQFGVRDKASAADYLRSSTEQVAEAA